MSFFNVFCCIESVLVYDINNVQVIISLFGWHLVFGTKNIQFLPSPEKFPLTRFGQNSDTI